MRKSLPLLFLLLIVSPLFSSDPGEILSYELEGTLNPEEIHEFNGELFTGYDAPVAKYSVDIYWVRFNSLYPDGADAPITAQVFIPRYEDRDSRSVYVFGAGSTGLRDSCRPSREHLLGIKWGLYRSHVLAHAGQGSIGILPDYMGFGDPDRLQYYMVAQSEARVLLDSIRALKNLIAELELETVSRTNHFVAGFSQGGHAAFAAADYRREYAPDVSLSGIMGYGPTTDLFSLFREYSDVAPMILYTYSLLYGQQNVDPSQVLLEKYSETLEQDLLRMCVGGIQAYYPHVPQGLFKEDFIISLKENTLDREYPLLSKYVEMNDTGLRGERIPVVIYQGGNDIVIYPETQKQFVDKLKARDIPVDYVFYRNARHDTRQISFGESRDWIEKHMN
ncbi:MAG: hypothetical protein JXR86_10390 [Spirochaetales bacterium]|nr:hypothetical protein [Spirochaetales bacterium]